MAGANLLISGSIWNSVLGGQDLATHKRERILRLKAVLERTGLSRSTLYRKIQEGSFPKQVRIAARCAGWRKSAIDGWLQNPMFYRIDDSPNL